MAESLLIMFICVSAVHMGLTDAICKVIHLDVKFIGCVKCVTFWCVLAWNIFRQTGIVESLAVAFLLAYVSLWFDLLMGAADALYLKIYGTINNAQDAYYDEAPPAAEHEEDTLPKL